MPDTGDKSCAICELKTNAFVAVTVLSDFNIRKRGLIWVANLCEIAERSEIIKNFLHSGKRQVWVLDCCKEGGI